MTLPTELISMSVTDVMMVGIVSPLGMRLPRLSKSSTSQIVKAMPLLGLTVSMLQVFVRSSVMAKERGEEECRSCVS